MKPDLVRICLGICAGLLLSACGTARAPESSPVDTPVVEQAVTDTEKRAEIEAPAEEEETGMLQMMIGETAVTVEWEENASVEALKDLCREEPLRIAMSMYGGFEQVGGIGTSLPRDDVQTTTAAGDVVLYAGDQLVVFYGSNAWAYTRLGHITDPGEADMETLLGRGDVTVTLRQEP